MSARAASGSLTAGLGGVGRRRVVGGGSDDGVVAPAAAGGVRVCARRPCARACASSGGDLGGIVYSVGRARGRPRLTWARRGRPSPAPSALVIARRRRRRLRAGRRRRSHPPMSLPAARKMFFSETSRWSPSSPLPSRPTIAPRSPRIARRNRAVAVEHLEGVHVLEAEQELLEVGSRRVNVGAVGRRAVDASQAATCDARSQRGVHHHETDTRRRMRTNALS